MGAPDGFCHFQRQDRIGRTFQDQGAVHAGPEPDLRHNRTAALSHAVNLIGADFVAGELGGCGNNLFGKQDALTTHAGKKNTCYHDRFDLIWLFLIY